MKKCLVIRSLRDPKHPIIAVITDVDTNGDEFSADAPRGTKYDMVIRNWCRNTGRVLEDYTRFYAEPAEVVSWTDLPQFA